METIKTLAGVVSKEKFNSKKYIRQLKTVIKWKNFNGKGVVEAATAYGKTFVARITIGKMLKSGKLKKVIIIVPRINLKQQWEEEISHFTDRCQIEVVVVNGYVSDGLKKSCDLLILDEIHLFASNVFSSLFDLTDYKFALGLTATLKRLDGREAVILDKLKVCDKITYKEALSNGWISEIIEINLPVLLTKEERREQNEINSRISKNFKFFKDFDELTNCCRLEGATAYVKSRNLVLEPKEVNIKANVLMALIRKRKEFIENCTHKLELTEEIIRRLKLKTITFSESINFPEKLHKKFPGSLIYHSSLKTITTKENVTVTKSYKSKAKAYNNFLNKMKSKGIFCIEYMDGNDFVISWEEEKLVKFTQEKQKVEAIHKIKKGNSKIIFTAKALDQGFDVDSMELGIESSRSRNPTQRDQRRGRIARLFTYENGEKKVGLYINLYIPDFIIKGSTDESKLLEVSSGDEIWVEDVKELYEVLRGLNFKIHEKLQPKQ
jgi:superfamily II DNA or RNA helicase